MYLKDYLMWYTSVQPLRSVVEGPSLDITISGVHDLFKLDSSSWLSIYVNWTERACTALELEQEQYNMEVVAFSIIPEEGSAQLYNPKLGS